MHWENDIADCPQLPEMYIPAELLEGLDRLSADGDLLKARLRWRPHLTAATGFLTKNRLLELRGQSVLEVARALASLATHLHDQGGCEAKFEAQVQRELETPGPEGAREWRSITFYVNQPQPDRSDDDVHDEDIYEPPPPPQSWASPGPTAPTVPDLSEYRSFVELSRTDPTAFAMMVMQQSNDRTASILERLLMSSVTRLDRVLGTQISNSRYLNEALQTLTKGANEVARMGMNLFNQGLTHGFLVLSSDAHRSFMCTRFGALPSQKSPLDPNDQPAARIGRGVTRRISAFADFGSSLRPWPAAHSGGHAHAPAT